MEAVYKMPVAFLDPSQVEPGNMTDKPRFYSNAFYKYMAEVLFPYRPDVTTNVSFDGQYLVFAIDCTTLELSEQKKVRKHCLKILETEEPVNWLTFELSTIKFYISDQYSL